MEEKVLCPYCGPWNGHPHGVKMYLDGNGLADPEQFGFPEQFWYSCPSCGAESPCMTSREKASSAAQRRFPPVEQIIWERDTAIKQLKDDYGVGFCERKLLDLQDLRPGDVVWLEEGDKPVCCVHLGYWSESWMGEKTSAIPIDFFRKEHAAFYLERDYGKKWRCWRARPKPEERAAAPWKGDA